MAKYSHTIVAALAATITLMGANAETLQQRNASSMTPLEKMAKADFSNFLNGKKNQLVLINPKGTSVAKAPGDGYEPDPKAVLLTEDFSSELFSTGQIGDPDLDTDLKLANPESESQWPAWYNLKAEAFGDGTQLWGGNYVYPAGGCACLFVKESYGIGASNLVVPLIDASTDGYEGIVRLKFLARLDDKSVPQTNLMLEAAETNHMAASWDILGQGVAEITNDWRQYEVAFYGGGESVILNFYNAFGQSVYLDDIEVYQEGQLAQTPTALPHTNYAGTSFTANWTDAPGAESFLLDVYKVYAEYDSYGYVTYSETTYVIEDLPVEGTSYDVTGVESGQKYYYYVRSVKGDFVSIASNVIEVNELMPTTLHAVSDLSDNGYTASWDVVPGAERYNYWARFERIAAQDGEFVITDEDFDDVVDADGQETGWTKEEPQQETYSQYYYTMLNQAGWRGLNSAPYEGYICLDAWQYIYGGTDAGLLSPELDLSKDGGSVHLECDMAATLFYYYDDDGTLVQGYPRAAVVIFNWDDELGDWRQDELHYSDGVEFDWTTQKFDLTTGSERSVIGIYAVYAPENLYLDNLRITQQYKAGESLCDPFLFARFHEGTELKVEVPKAAYNTKLYHQVCGTRSEIVQGNFGSEIAYLESPYTPLTLVDGSDTTWSGLSTPTLSGASVRPAGDMALAISNPEGAAISICDVAGRIVYANATGAIEAEVTLPARGVYMVTIGTRTVKVKM